MAYREFSDAGIQKCWSHLWIWWENLSFADQRMLGPHQWIFLIRSFHESSTIYLRHASSIPNCRPVLATTVWVNCLRGPGPAQPTNLDFLSKSDPLNCRINYPRAPLQLVSTHWSTFWSFPSSLNNLRNNGTKQPKILVLFQFLYSFLLCPLSTSLCAQ